MTCCSTLQHISDWLTAAMKSCLRVFSSMVRGMFLTLRRVRDTLKLGLRSLVFFSSAARLRFVLSVTDKLSQAADPSSMVPSFACTHTLYQSFCLRLEGLLLVLLIIDGLSLVAHPSTMVPSLCMNTLGSVNTCHMYLNRLSQSVRAYVTALCCVPLYCLSLMLCDLRQSSPAS